MREVVFQASARISSSTVLTSCGTTSGILRSLTVKSAHSPGSRRLVGATTLAQLDDFAAKCGVDSRVDGPLVQALKNGYWLLLD